jgi:triosephosphate isomerase (TIM)
MRDKKLIVGNWKMNLNMHEASLYLHKLSENTSVHRTVEVVVAPTTLTLQSLSLQISRRQFKLAAQNFYWRDHGAFTGEVSATQLRGIVDYAIVGHSERRHIFHESDKDIRNKVQAAIRNHIRPILCIGETAGERAEGETQDVLHDQLVSGLANITSEELAEVVIAYEPVWALSNGKDFNNHPTPTPDDAAKVAAYIRDQLKHLFGKQAASDMRILYGGSANDHNAKGFLSAQGIDGLLIGGASLDARAFSTIVEIAHGSAEVVRK